MEINLLEINSKCFSLTSLNSAFKKIHWVLSRKHTSLRTKVIELMSGISPAPKGILRDRKLRQIPSCPLVSYSMNSDHREHSRPKGNHVWNDKKTVLPTFPMRSILGSSLCVQCLGKPCSGSFRSPTSKPRDLKSDV